MKGYHCWFCGRRFAKKGEHPTLWVEFICGRDDCNESTWPWVAK